MIESYQKRIEDELAKAILLLGPTSPLRDACAYACLNGGKRLRPLLVLLIAETLPQRRDIMPAALSVEYFHTASLIADDLPCMDNDSLRRGKPSLHREFGESVAILASYTLVAAGYGGICEASRQLKEREPQEAAQIDAAMAICLERTAHCAGLCGATYGQFLDLFPPSINYERVRKMVEYKTASLFEVSFTFGWLLGGGEQNRLAEIKRCSSSLGIAFQIVDDLDDLLQDEGQKNGSNEGQKSKANLAQLLGIEKACALFEEELESFTLSLKSLGLWTDPFFQLCDLLQQSQLRALRQLTPPIFLA